MTSTMPVGTVGYERTVKVRDYESAKASVFIQFDLNGMNAEQIMANATAAFFQAKALVFDELGIQFNVDAGGVVREAINGTFGQVTEVTPTRPHLAVAPTAAPTFAAPAPAPVAAAPVVDASQPPHDPATTDKGQKAANARWAKARLGTHPDEFWDNAQAKAEGRFSPKSPDFKHKDTGLAVWND